MDYQDYSTHFHHRCVVSVVEKLEDPSEEPEVAGSIITGAVIRKVLIPLTTIPSPITIRNC